ncbi:hypothetical protein [Coleofasciculus sp.]|uniref:hypothetical protein n=1 Tax=Coleofasciculus sp. TaxID=3100458 RepID=UPI0039F9BDB4
MLTQISITVLTPITLSMLTRERLTQPRAGVRRKKRDTFYEHAGAIAYPMKS